MRRSIAWVAGIAGLLAALFLRRRRPQTEQPDPAEELRRTLAAQRVEPGPEVSQAPAPEAPAASDTDARRREVHDHARAAIEEMRGDAA